MSKRYVIQFFDASGRSVKGRSDNKISNVCNWWFDLPCWGEHKMDAVSSNLLDTRTGRTYTYDQWKEVVEAIQAKERMASS